MIRFAQIQRLRIFNAAPLACDRLYALFVRPQKLMSTSAVVTWRTMMLSCAIHGAR
jgi:hypothetical protein